MVVGNPIFFREFVSTARAWKTRFLICSYLLALAALLLLLWPSGGIHSVVTESSRKIFSMFFSANLMLLLLIVPAFTAGSITLERERGTYPALFFTLLSPMSIMAGKLASSVLMLLIVCVLSFPIAALCALTGGVDMAFMSKMIFLLLITTVSYGLLGLACSSICQKTSTAIVLSYVYILLLSGATWLPSALLSNLLPDLNPVWQIIRCISPFDAMTFLLYPDTYKISMTIQSSSVDPYNIFVLFSGILGAFSFGVFNNNLRKPALSAKVRRGNVYATTRTMIKRKLTFPFYLLDPLRRKKPIGRFRNPVFVTEMRSKLFANPQFVLRSVSTIFILSMVLMLLVAMQFAEQLKPDHVKIVSVIFQVGVVALLAPGVSSGLITEEITAGTFTALRMTPLTPLTLILGKLKATFFYALIFIVSGFFILVALTFLQIQDVEPNLSIYEPDFWAELTTNCTSPEWLGAFWATYRSLFIWTLILLLTTMTSLCAGLFASTIAANTSVATALSYGFTGFLCVVTLLPIPLEDKLSHSFSGFLLSFNPIAAACQVMNADLKQFPDLWLRNIYTMIGIIVFFLIASTLRVWYLYRKSE